MNPLREMKPAAALLTGLAVSGALALTLMASAKYVATLYEGSSVQGYVEKTFSSTPAQRQELARKYGAYRGLRF